MPSIPVVRYPFDPTGLDRNNLVLDEQHTLSPNKVRVFAPNYGPFYSESLRVLDKVTLQPLQAHQYKAVELLKEATVKTGKEVCAVVLILDENVSANVEVSYQNVGGLYMNDSSAIASMYETVIKDNRPVDWENVLNKPYEYPPSLHRHLLHEIYGFEPVVVALERIHNAIILGNIPAFERLIQWVKDYMKGLEDRVAFLENKKLDVVTEEEIIAGVGNGKAVSFERLLFALDKFNFNGTTITPMSAVTKNSSVVQFDVQTTNVNDYTSLYWTIEHINTDDTDFGTVAGQFTMIAGKGSFNITLTKSSVDEELEQFRVVVRREGIDGPVMGKTSLLTIKKFKTDTYGFMDFMNSCCFTSPASTMNAVHFFMRDSQYA